MAKRNIEEINAGSMADIAFLLLIFFLVATTMNVDTGLARMLPPMPDPNQKMENMKVNTRNTLRININASDVILIGSQVVDVTMVKDKAKEFLLNPANDPNLPEKVIKDIPLIGQFPVSEGIISLQNNRGTSYNMYVMVQNELTRALNEVRDATSLQQFGKKFADLSEAQSEAITKAIPNRISEAEPVEI